MPAKRYFEFSDGSSNKFWEVWCAGAELFTRYGKIGASGQVTVKKLASKDAAQKQHDQLVKEKTGKGYREKGATKTASKTAAPEVAIDQPRYVDVPAGTLYLEAVVKDKRVFWQSRLDKRTVHTTTGEVGTAGKTTKRAHKDEWRARSDQRTKLEDYLKKGYGYVLTGKPPKRPGVAASNAQIEAQLMKDPSDDALAVYADWLQEHDDVRGELAVLQTSAAANPKDKKLANAATKLLWDQRGYFYGPLARYVTEEGTRQRAVVATWRAGWMDSLELGAARGRESPSVSRVEELIPFVPRVASARFLRELVISRPRNDEYEFRGAIDEVVAIMPGLPTLRRLTIGQFTSDENELSWSHLSSVGKLWKVAGALEYMKFRAGSLSLGKIDLPSCREFRVETGGLDKGTLKTITSAAWPKLETLSVWFGMDNYGCTCTMKDVQPILDGKGLGKVKHLGLKNSEFGDAIATAIVKSKIIRQLDTLDLSMSHITTADIEKLLPHKAAFAKLSHLDLSRCLLDDKGVKLAKQLAKNVNLDRQGDHAYYAEDPEYRYAAVGE